MTQPLPPPPQAPYSGGGQQPGKPNGLAIASMVLGIVGLLFFVFFVPAILALIFGFVALNQINRPGNVQTGKGMAIAGIVLGAVSIVFVVILLAAGGGDFNFEVNS